MAFASANSVNEPRALSLGVIKMQIITCTAAAADTAGTVTADKLTTITDIVVPGLQLTSAPTIAGNVATLAFVAVPTGGFAGTIICFGR